MTKTTCSAIPTPAAIAAALKVFRNARTEGETEEYAMELALHAALRHQLATPASPYYSRRPSNQTKH